MEAASAEVLACRTNLPITPQGAGSTGPEAIAADQ
jgi:hypothetical protein